MSSGLYSHTTRGTGTVLTAAIYNADHQNHITNQNPTMTGGYADDVAQYRLKTDPGAVGTEALPANLAGEIERLRFVLSRLLGTTHWYEAPASTIAAIQAAVSGGNVNELKITNELAPPQITADQNDYAPTGHATAFCFRLTSDALRAITGLAGGVAGRLVLLHNVGSQTIALTNEDPVSTAANRFSLGGLVNILAGRSALLRYNTNTSRWVRVGSADLAFASFSGVSLSQWADFTENAAPGDPAADTARMYAQDVSGTTKLFFRNSAGGVTPISPADVQEFSSSGTWNKPTGKTWALIRAWGGGGSGARGGANRAGGGGGGGSYKERWMKVSDLGATEAVTIGAGGASATVDQTNGNAGGDSTFGAHVTGFGGGFGSSNSGTPNGAGGGGGGMLGAGANASGSTGGNGGLPRPVLFVIDSTSGTAIDQGTLGTSSDARGNMNIAGGGAGGNFPATNSANGGDSIWGGGGGGSGSSSTGGAGGNGGGSVWGGGGGGGASEATGPVGTGGTSAFGGNGGGGGIDTTPGTAGAVPGGGGGGSEQANSGAGGNGLIQVICF